jgi:hypothetical protein
MYRIIDERGSGKTSRLMLIAKENNATFVCNNPDAMKYKAQAYGITGINFISYSEYLQKEYHNRGEKFVIDEVEALLHRFTSPGELIGYSLSLE